MRTLFILTFGVAITIYITLTMRRLEALVLELSP
jgi:hypothetical protein